MFFFGLCDNPNANDPATSQPNSPPRQGKWSFWRFAQIFGATWSSRLKFFTTPKRPRCHSGNNLSNKQKVSGRYPLGGGFWGGRTPEGGSAYIFFLKAVPKIIVNYFFFASTRYPQREIFVAVDICIQAGFISKYLCLSNCTNSPFFSFPPFGCRFLNCWGRADPPFVGGPQMPCRAMPGACAPHYLGDTPIVRVHIYFQGSVILKSFCLRNCASALPITC